MTCDHHLYITATLAEIQTWNYCPKCGEPLRTDRNEQGEFVVIAPIEERPDFGANNSTRRV